MLQRMSNYSCYIKDTNLFPVLKVMRTVVRFYSMLERTSMLLEVHMEHHYKPLHGQRIWRASAFC